MATTSDVAPAQADDERQAFAPEWKRTWWRFRSHRVAVVGTGIVVLLYVVAIFAEFFAIHDPRFTDSQRAFVPPQRIHIFEGWKPTPWVYGDIAERNPVTLQMEHRPDTSTKHYIQFFDRGHEYKLLGLFDTNIHLMGVDIEGKNGTFLPSGHGPAGERRILPAGLRRKNIHVYRSRGRGCEPLSWHAARRDFGICRRLGRRVDSAARRIPARHTYDPALDDHGGGDTQGLVGYKGVLRPHADHLFPGVDDSGEGGPRTFLDFEGGRLRSSGPALRYQPSKDHLPSHGPIFTSHIIAVTTLAVPAIIIAETALSFLGLGLREPSISWGVLLRDAQSLPSVALAPWLLLPGALVIITVLAFNFMGDGLRDAADPYAVIRQ